MKRTVLTEPINKVYRSRQEDFDDITKSLGSYLVISSRDYALAQGDSSNLLKKLPDHSVSLIVTDPPYHSTKKRNIHGDTAFQSDEHYLQWISELAREWKRILKPNGSLYCFCASEMAARIEIAFSKNFNVLSHIVWTKPNEPGFDGWKQKMKKEALRQWYPHSERVLFSEPACPGNLRRSHFGHYLREMRILAGLSTYQLAEEVGAYGKVNHGGSVSNWEAGRNIPSREQYFKICKALVASGKVASMPDYEDVIRPFSVNGSMNFTDVWDFPSVKPYKGKHPAEKPQAMLEHVIEASTFPGDIVLDCFAGSGSTALATSKLGRRSISIEIETKWVRRICECLGVEEVANSAYVKRNGVMEDGQLSIFSK